MPIKPNFTRNDVKNHFDKFLDVVEKRSIARMKYLGEMCVTHARSIPADIGYKDQTGALRSSTGYTVFLNGIAVHENFKSVNGNSEGIEAAKKLCDEVAEKYPEGILLVVVAGMNYAILLESEGRDVLTSAEQIAEYELPQMIEKLKLNIAKSFQES